MLGDTGQGPPCAGRDEVASDLQCPHGPLPGCQGPRRPEGGQVGHKPCEGRDGHGSPKQPLAVHGLSRGQGRPLGRRWLCLNQPLPLPSPLVGPTAHLPGVPLGWQGRQASAAPRGAALPAQAATQPPGAFGPLPLSPECAAWTFGEWGVVGRQRRRPERAPPGRPLHDTPPAPAGAARLWRGGARSLRPVSPGGERPRARGLGARRAPAKTAGHASGRPALRGGGSAAPVPGRLERASRGCPRRETPRKPARVAGPGTPLRPDALAPCAPRAPWVDPAPLERHLTHAPCRQGPGARGTGRVGHVRRAGLGEAGRTQESLDATGESDPGLESVGARCRTSSAPQDDRDF